MDTTSYETKMPRDEFMRAEIERRGLRLERTGKAWKITGKGVDVSVARLEDLNVSTLRPHHHTDD